LDGHDAERVTMTAMLRRLRSSSVKRADAFASAHFGSCREHLREAVAVHLSLERLCGKPLANLDPEVTIAELLPASQVKGAHHIEEHQTLGQALRSRELVTLALGQLAAEKLVDALLGSTARQSSWDPHTIWTRSVRGVVNERVKNAGHCSCVEAGSRPTRS
jgi:hypothetical protein